ncbi:MAG: preprotein translocase subunit SecA [Planctomycetota bacterium]
MFDKISTGFGKLLQKLFGSQNQRAVNQLLPFVQAVNAKEEAVQRLSDSDFPQETEKLRKRLVDGESLDDLLPESFALVREAAKRTLGLRHYDVQIMGGVVLHQGKITEMATGEGKTLVATAPLYLNALTGKKVYLVTVNDYLAKRDCEWMSPVYDLLGMSVGAIQSGMNSEERQVEYSHDIVYGTNNEFGFDYLRDNMKARAENQVQRSIYYAIIDEVDSILIDEARTPLIISGMPETSVTLYYKADSIAKRLREDEHFEKKEKENSCPLTDEGIEYAQKLAGVESFYSGSNMDWPHHIEQALRANYLFKKDKEYVIRKSEEGVEVVIVDEFTGRLMPGRRWSDGLHQAVEAKEGIQIKEESQTLATITFQNYFRLYEKLAGMTGTAMTEAGEFAKIYSLDVVSIPTNLPMIRRDNNDIVYRTLKEKNQAIIDEIVRLNSHSRPVLVGTTSIASSEHLSEMLGRRGVQHEVLNAKHHEREASIVAKAGEYGHVTIATNMAGRGTDIKLGEGVICKDCIVPGTKTRETYCCVKCERPERANQCEACFKGPIRNRFLKGDDDLPACEDDIRCGLHIIGTERHDARRIDNQLRGRSGRQGDPGSSRFFLSLDDDLMRIFARDWVKTMLEKLGMTEGQEIESRMVSRGIENAQKKVEARNFEIRKNLLEYDEVMDKQRKTIYETRQEILDGENLRDKVVAMISDTVADLMDTYLGEKARDWNLEDFNNRLKQVFLVSIDPDLLQNKERALVDKMVTDLVLKRYDEIEAKHTPEQQRALERYVLLDVVDSKWKDHLYAMDALKSGIGLRSYAQVDPKVEYKREGFEKFQMLLQTISATVASLVFKMVLREKDEQRLENRWSGEAVHEQASTQTGFAQQRQGMDQAIQASGKGGMVQPLKRKAPKVGRNDLCPCGSGRKYKKCCFPRFGS